MIFRRAITAACAVLGLSMAQPAAAACQLKTQPIKVTMQGLRPIVTAKINGREGHFILDSGGVINSLNGRFAAELSLKPLRVAETGTLLSVDASTQIQSVAGVNTINGLVRASKFEFEGAVFKDVGFMATSRLTDEDGLLGQPFLKGVDVEYDLGAGMVRLAKPEGCGGANLAYWVKDGGTYSVLPLEWIDRDDPHTEAAIYINGVRMRAMFDTGSPLSLITENAAARAGVKTSDAGVTPWGQVQGLDGQFKTWIGTFSSVKIGDEEIKNAPLEIAQSGVIFYDVLLGADFFSSHHLYVANSQGKIYFTYSGGQVFATPNPRSVATQK